MAKKTPEEYINIINQYPNAKFPEIGKIYIFAYLFNQVTNKKKSYNQLKDEGEIKFYDFLPAVFVWKIRMDNYSLFGFNLHTIPINHRRRWIEILQHYAGDEKPDPKKFMPLKRLLEQTQLIRQYNMRKVKKIKEIPVNQWKDLLEFDVNSSFKATNSEITAKYLGLIK